MYAVRSFGYLLIAHLALATGPAEAQQPEKPSLESKIANALSAAPADIAANAEVKDSDGAVLRDGRNGFTCYPASGPEDTPICVNAQFLKFVDARRRNVTPELDGFAIGFEFQGGSVVSNTDPYAEPGDEKFTYGPAMVIIVPDPSVTFKDISADPYSGGPWVMWKGTPYAHLHIPLKKRPDKD